MKTRFFNFRLVLPLGLYAAISPLAAQDSYLDMSLEELLDVEIVSGASRHQQDISDSPASVNILTAKDIQRYGYRSLSEILASLRGFFDQQEAAYDYLGTRGFLPTGDFGTRLLVLIDGRKVNDLLFGSPGLAREFPLDVDIIQRVEVVHGPSSSLYGANAFFAVINIYTKRGEHFSGGEISASIENDQRLESRFSYGKKLENGMDVLFSMTTLNYPGKNTYIPFYDDPAWSLSNGITENRDKEQVSNVFGRLSHEGWTLQAAYVHRDKNMAMPYAGMAYDADNGVGDVRAYLDIAWRHDFSEELETATHLSYNYATYRGDYHFPGDTPAEETFLNRDEHVGRWLNAEWQMHWHSGKHEVSGGMELQQNYARLRNYDVTDYYETMNLEVDNNYWSVYVQDAIQFNNAFSMNLGVRYDHYEAFGSTTNPRAALIYQPRSDTTLKLLGGSAFRAPTMVEAYFGDDLWIKTNPGLESETIQAYEFALEHRFDKDTRAMASVYTYTIDDVIEYSFDEVDGLLFYDNVSKVDVKGFELEFQKHWDNGLDMHIAYSYHEAENADSGERIASSPRSLAKIRLGKSFYDNWYAGLEVRYRGRTAPGREPYETLDSYFLTNLTLSGEVMKNLRVSASVYNLLDADYAYPLSEDFDPDRYAGDRRSFRVKLNYRF